MLVYLREGEDASPTTESATTSLLGGTTTANNAGIDEPISGEEPRGNGGAANDDEVSRDAVVVSESIAQDSDAEASHGAAIEDAPMDYGFVNAKEGTETCQDGLIIEESSVGNGAADADGAQERGAERVSAAQGAQEVERNDSMDSGGIVGAGAQLGAVEDVEDAVATMSNGTAANADGAQVRGAGELGDAQGVQVVGRSYRVGLEGSAGAGAQLDAAGNTGEVLGGISGSRSIVGEGSGAATAEEGKKPKVRGKKKGGKQSKLSTSAQKGFRRDRDKDNGGLRK